FEHSQGATALTIASENGHTSTAHVLITHGANIDYKTSDGVNSLIHAAREGKDEVVSLLVIYGANIEAVTNDGKTPLLMACIQGQLNTAKILLEEGANPRACDNNGITPIQVAIKKGYNDLVSIMSNSPTERLQSIHLNQDASKSSSNTNSTPSGESKSPVSAATSNLECVVCMDPRTSTVMTLPCRHAVTCQKCTDDMESR
ncbi:unnamed protein product, partial [Meganyctiphanes norvegica]